MGNLLSQNNLDQLFKEEIKSLGKTRFEELKRSQKLKDHTNVTHSIFLCHSHLDKTIVDKIVILFNKINIELYVDWMDLDMPRYTDRNTARIIREKIDKAHKFIFLATYNALRSKWCNWELGIAYSSKGENDFAILPIESRTGKWTGNEYLQLYPEMKIDGLENMHSLKAEDIRISFYDNRTMNFIDWILK
ncbi:toll/interleukin-1 receptor domain-containing protein [Sphingobacterium sp.]|uniref:toll/interleukin-1 receptor domain-containing protein n=1 Tax=Sphingobacterium sp. TaxID=341027 RepID=UPI0028B03705|nr:toll/interleukin-1 receptor domain-containing protein [Sphingobacterium sp.]